MSMTEYALLAACCILAIGGIMGSRIEMRHQKRIEQLEITVHAITTVLEERGDESARIKRVENELGEHLRHQHRNGEHIEKTE